MRIIVGIVNIYCTRIRVDTVPAAVLTRTRQVHLIGDADPAPNFLETEN
jgi:hypothetical protein